MGLFNLFKSPLIVFLKSTEEIYDRAFCRRDYHDVDKFFSQMAIRKIQFYSNNPIHVRNYGDSLFKNIQYEEVDFDKETQTFLIIKYVLYNRITLRKGLNLVSGKDYAEQWIIKKLSRNKFLVEDIVIERFLECYQ